MWFLTANVVHFTKMSLIEKKIIREGNFYKKEITLSFLKVFQEKSLISDHGNITISLDNTTSPWIHQTISKFPKTSITFQTISRKLQGYGHFAWANFRSCVRQNGKNTHSLSSFHGKQEGTAVLSEVFHLKITLLCSITKVMQEFFPRKKATAKLRYKKRMQNKN